LLGSIARRAMLERGLLPEFSAAALTQSDAITGPAAAAGSAIRDLRALLWASIDNDDSRDLDQLSVAQPLGGGAVKILVAIADVDAVVRRSSPIDDHARTNTTSVYTVPRIFPMLPEKLSTNLTSLGEGQERLAIVVDMTVTADGGLGASEVYRALVRNQAKLAYNPIMGWALGWRAAVPHQPAWPRFQDSMSSCASKTRSHRRSEVCGGLTAHWRWRPSRLCRCSTARY
jgi:exoribonuclease R